MIRTVTYALNPSAEQERLLRSHCGAARFAFNTELARIKADLEAHAEGKPTVLDGWSAYSLRRDFNSIKGDVAPWWPEVSKEAFASGTASLAAALANWRASKTGVRAGRAMGFPGFRGRDTRQSFTYTTGSLRLGDDRRSVVLPRIGAVATHENTAKVHRRLAKGTARISRITVSQHRGRWRASLLIHLSTDHERAKHPASQSVVGLDVGCKDLIVAATPEGREVMRVPMPAELAALDQAKRRLQRRGSRKEFGDRRTHTPKSNRARAHERRVARLDHRAANLREDILHTATTSLTREFGVVAVEHLSVAGMSARGGAYKRGLNRSIARSALARTRTLVKYKTAREGGVSVAADRFFPSSKTCSNCAVVKAKLRLSERTFVCEDCGFSLDRDLNAAINLARLGASNAESGSVSGRGAWRKTATLRGSGSLGDEASTHP